MKRLNGAELADYIKQRQVRQARGLRQSAATEPRLAIVLTGDDVPSQTYVRLKETYGKDVEVAVDVHRVDAAAALATVVQLNEDAAVHGIIVQLPLSDPAQTDEVIGAIDPRKDVDALASTTYFDAATPLAIDWLLTGYGIELTGKKLLVIGQGRLVGAPLSARWRAAGYVVTVVSGPSDDLARLVREADVVVTATGVPGLVTSTMLRPGTIVVDAGTSSDGGRLRGDVADDARARTDLIMTPERGGVGPLTVAALFDNVLKAARTAAEAKTD
ncbi:MAG TPA: bifunctional 5,10-methylenetetrahydrofolate dehydrogenase/5,10-methenyltetrahydrofolate cyclohydrolase [Candidatus Saccharimonadales bacterium]|jgi:methylenetetrahydrofolate dehydrogenase (NADP+)/methenyltetrahydrofolate cyclohydrolase